MVAARGRKVSELQGASRTRLVMVSRRGPGGAGGVVPPVPIPNTVVKRSSADDTAWATAWDNRPVPGPVLTSSVQSDIVTGRRKTGQTAAKPADGIVQSTLTIEEWWGA